MHSLLDPMNSLPTQTLLCLVVLFASASTGCGDCAGVGVSRVTPTDATIRVGESVNLLYETGGGCVSNDRVTNIDVHSAPTTWHTTDTLVVRLDSLTGIVTGRTPGTAQVRGGPSLDTVTIHVQ